MRSSSEAHPPPQHLLGELQWNPTLLYTPFRAFWLTVCRVHPISYSRYQSSSEQF